MFQQRQSKNAQNQQNSSFCPNSQSSLTSPKLLTRQQFLAHFRKNNRLAHNFKANKRHLRADVLSLLSSALRPRLLSSSRRNSEITHLPLQNIENTEQIDSHFWAIFTANRGIKRQNRAKIVVMSTILFVFSVFLVNFATPVSAASLTLSLPSDPLSIDLSPVNSFKESNTASVSVSTTDANWGYNFSIKAKDSNALKNGEFSLNSISQSYSLDDFKNKAPANTWGFKPSKKDSVDNANYLPSPTSTETLIEKTSSNSTSPISYSFNIAAKIDSSLKHGEYSNTFVLTIIANTASYSITYNLNGGSTGPTSPQTGTTTEKSISLDPSTPTRSGYEFLGWCTNNPGTATTCSGTTYQPGNNYTLSSENTNTPLYAIWKSTKPQYGETCNSTGEVMMDGKCWSSSDVSEASTWSNASTLCKSPWRLPSQSDFNNLIRAHYPSASTSPAGGYSYNGSDVYTFVYKWGKSASWWSSTIFGSDSAYILSIETSYISSDYTRNKDKLSHVRCVSEI